MYVAIWSNIGRPLSGQKFYLSNSACENALNRSFQRKIADLLNLSPSWLYASSLKCEKFYKSCFRRSMNGEIPDVTLIQVTVSVHIFRDESRYFQPKLLSNPDFFRGFYYAYVLADVNINTLGTMHCYTVPQYFCKYSSEHVQYSLTLIYSQQYLARMEKISIDWKSVKLYRCCIELSP